MSECSQKPCKQRFKGVENFLRRVAFNLGNTASQTEVKIISCIPIDVTDLQQKIINLEKQLCEAQEEICKGRSTKNDKSVVNSHSTLVNTAFYNPAFTKESSNLSYCRRSHSGDMNIHHVAIHLDNCSSRDKKSTVSFVPIKHCEGRPTSKLDSFASSNNVSHKPILIERYKNIFKTRIRKKNKGKGNLKTHLVYYAQTPNNAFYLNQNRKQIDTTEALCRTHLNNIVTKQYDPNVIEEFSDTSNFTAPICRDVNRLNNSFDRGSDVCSCSYGKFQNIDNYMTPQQNYNNYIADTGETIVNNDLYRDSRDYDLIPVKENPLKNLNKKDTKIDIDIKCWPELLRAKQRNHPLVVNYQTEFIPNTRQIHRNVQKIQEKMKPKDINKKGRSDKLEANVPSKRGFVEYSDVYKRDRRPKNYLQKSEPVKVIVLKNEVTSTNEIEQANTEPAASELNTVDTKTASTLDQIKTMLQTVLTEIKTSGKLSNSVAESVKKDAVVQKSLNNIQGASTLLNSFTYNNSYSVNPYMASYSRQIPYCVTSIPYQPMKVENFPVFIHSSPRKNMCMCYYKNSGFKQTNTATNTDKDKQEGANNETEKLIKDIYNSMALNLDLTTKENSLSECGDVKSADGSTNTAWKEINSKKATNKRDIEVEAILTSLDSYSNYSKTTHSASTQSDIRSRTQTLYHVNNKDFGYPKNFAYNRGGRGKPIVEDDETDESSDGGDSVDTVVSNRYGQNKAEKKSLLQRMFKSVKLFRTKKHESQKRFETENLVSDSDDYETIYSKQSTIPPPQKIRQNPRKYQKIQNVPQNKQKRPYLEQEYRRHWNENLTFHDQNQHSNENQMRNYKNIPFWTNYETRHVAVDNKPNNMNVRPPSYNASPKTNIKGKDKLNWLKKHKLGLKCGEQWKNFILEN